ncbi:MAG: acyltransferase [Flammeovirgaceae bacterium TMED32]|mgnify:FL=1|nr:MAG: acyltransferase [Flammeovirgaceae bacterium TMED32]|tara:strand:- start:391 stop:1275 length:885 start_codon:yes stop_codon:yes gene_type:complete
MTKIKVGIVQQKCSTSKKTNIEMSIEGIHQCASKGAQLVVLPELHVSRYFCQQEASGNFDLAESLPGPTYNNFAEIARSLKIVLVTSLFEKRSAGLFHNTAVVFDKDGREAGRYRKMHIPDDPGYYEKFYFTPGDLGFKPITTSLGKLGVLICWDQWFPEAARLMAMAGANLLIYPTAIGYDPGDTYTEKSRQHDAWMTSQRAHAIANGISVISVNRVGFEEDLSHQTKGIDFWGSSFVAGPQGEVLWKADPNEMVNQVVETDQNRTEAVRRIWPFFRDRRIDAYTDMNQRFID